MPASAAAVGPSRRLLIAGCAAAAALGAAALGGWWLARRARQRADDDALFRPAAAQRPRRAPGDPAAAGANADADADTDDGDDDDWETSDSEATDPELMVDMAEAHMSNLDDEHAALSAKVNARRSRGLAPTKAQAARLAEIEVERAETVEAIDDICQKYGVRPRGGDGGYGDDSEDSGEYGHPFGGYDEYDDDGFGDGGAMLDWGADDGEDGDDGEFGPDSNAAAEALFRQRLMRAAAVTAARNGGGVNGDDARKNENGEVEDDETDAAFDARMARYGHPDARNRAAVYGDDDEGGAALQRALRIAREAAAKGLGPEEAWARAGGASNAAAPKAVSGVEVLDDDETASESDEDNAQAARRGKKGKRGFKARTTVGARAKRAAGGIRSGRIVEV